MNNLVTVNNGIATTTSLVIAEQFGRKHSHVLRSIEKVIGRYEIVPTSYLDSNNHPHKMYVLPEREALIVMPFIGGQKSIEGQERLVDAFLTLRNMAIERSPLEKRLERIESEISFIKRRQLDKTVSGIDLMMEQKILDSFRWDADKSLWKNRMTITAIYQSMFSMSPARYDLVKIKPILAKFGVKRVKPKNVQIFYMPPTR